MERRHLSSHQENECVYRQYKCQHCGFTDTYDAIAGSGRMKNRHSNIAAGSGNHYNECAEYPLECPNKCSDNNIRRRDLNTHKDTVCPLEPFKCPYSDYCSLKDIILRRDLESHKKVCPYKCEYCGYNRTSTYTSMYGKHPFTIDMESHKKECDSRPYKCQYCQFAGTSISITGIGNNGTTRLVAQCHYDICEEYPLDCPNKCEAYDIKRKNMKKHREKCPLELLNCQFNYVGCTSTKQRRSMDQHCQQNMQEHLLLVAQSHHELAQKNKDLVSKNKELASKIEEVLCKSCEDYQRLSRRVEELTRKNEGMTVRSRQHPGIVRAGQFQLSD